MAAKKKPRATDDIDAEDAQAPAAGKPEEVTPGDVTLGEERIDDEDLPEPKEPVTNAPDEDESVAPGDVGLADGDDVPDDEPGPEPNHPLAVDGAPFPPAGEDVETPEDGEPGAPKIDPEDVGLQPEGGEDVDRQSELLELRAEQDASPVTTAPVGVDAGGRRGAIHQAKIEQNALNDSEAAAPEAFRATAIEDADGQRVEASGEVTRPDHTTGAWTVSVGPHEDGASSSLIVSGVGVGGHRGFARVFPGDQHTPFDFEGDEHTLEFPFMADGAIVNVDGSEIRVGTAATPTQVPAVEEVHRADLAAELPARERGPETQEV